MPAPFAPGLAESYNPRMINGIHALIYASDAARARGFFKDVLKLDSVNAGDGWLIFALPPAEVGFHPVMEGEGERHEMYFMCKNVEASIRQLAEKGVRCSPIMEAGWGRLTQFEVPGAGKFGLYQPLHPVAHEKKKQSRKPARKSRHSRKSNKARRR